MKLCYDDDRSYIDDYNEYDEEDYINDDDNNNIIILFNRIIYSLSFIYYEYNL